MNKRLIFLILILVITACSPTPTVVPLSPTFPADNPAMIPATAMPQAAIPTATVQPSLAITDTPPASGTLWLQILSPQEEAVVNTPQVEVIGSAPVGAVVSVNDEILVVGDDQQFQTTVSLDEGPNLIEIVASDENGNEMPVLLTITYEP
jgi:hypothetical protein